MKQTARIIRNNVPLTLLSDGVTYGEPLYVPTVAAARLLPDPPPQAIIIGSASSPASGIFYWDPDRVDADNGTSIIKVTAITNGRYIVVTQTSSGVSTTVQVADLTALRAYAVAGLINNQVVSVGSPPKTWIYSSDSGAGFADDGITIVKPNSVLTASNGRYYPSDSSPVVPTIAALRAAVSGKHSVISVQSFSSLDDGGGGIFDYDASDTTSADDGGTIIVAGTRRYKRRFSGDYHAEWFGFKDDAIFSTDGVLTNGSSTLTTNSDTFTSADVGKLIFLGVPEPGTQGTGTIDVTASSTTVTGNGTQFLTELYPGAVLAYKDADNSAPAQAVNLLIVKSVETNTSLTVWQGTVFHTKTLRTWYRTNQWMTTIQTYVGPREVTLAESSVVRWVLGGDPVVRFVRATDSRASLITAITATPAGATLCLPEGNYLFSDSIPMGDKSFTLRGPSASWKQTGFSFCGGPENITAASTTTGAVLQFGQSHGIVTSGKCTIKNLCLVGPGSHGYHGIYMDEDPGGSIDVNVENCMVANWQRGLAMAGAIDCRIRSIKGIGCAEGAIVLGERVVDGDMSCIDHEISNIDAQLCGAGVKLMQATNVRFIGGIIQSNLSDWHIAPFDSDPGGGVQGIDGILAQGIYEEANEHTLWFDSQEGQDGICRNFRFSDVTFGNNPETVTMGRPGVYAVMGGFIFDKCVLGGIKFSFPSNMEIAKVQFNACDLPTDTDRITIVDASKVQALDIEGADTLVNAIPTNTRESTGGAYAINLTKRYGSVIWVQVNSDITFGAPTNAFKGARLRMLIERTTSTVSWNAVFKTPPEIPENQSTFVEWYTPDGTNWYHSAGTLGTAATATDRVVRQAPIFVTTEYSIDRDYQLTTLGTSVALATWPLDVPHGATINSVSVKVIGAGGHGALPATMPCVKFRKWNISTASGTVSSGTNDGSASVGAFEAAHTITRSGIAEVVNNSTTRYGVQFESEGGANAVAGLLVVGVTVNFTTGTAFDRGAA